MLKLKNEFINSSRLFILHPRMNYNKLVSFFLILVLSIQLLPLQQIAQWLTSGQLTEEISHGINPEKPDPANEDGNGLYAMFGMAEIHYSATNVSAKNKRCSNESLFRRYYDDILTPPPNC